MQGVYRGLGDTRTPLWGTLACNAINILLAPLLIFTADWGCRGAALATVASQVSTCPENERQVWGIPVQLRAHCLCLMLGSDCRRLAFWTGITSRAEAIGRAGMSMTCAQAIAGGWLIYRLKQRYPLRMAGRDAMKNLSKFLGPTGDPPHCVPSRHHPAPSWRLAKHIIPLV